MEFANRVTGDGEPQPLLFTCQQDLELILGGDRKPTPPHDRTCLGGASPYKEAVLPAWGFPLWESLYLKDGLYIETGPWTFSLTTKAMKKTQVKLTKRQLLTAGTEIRLVLKHDKLVSMFTCLWLWGAWWNTFWHLYVYILLMHHQIWNYMYFGVFWFVRYIWIMCHVLSQFYKLFIIVWQ